MHTSEPITYALRDLARGDASAMDRVMPAIYAELRRLAGYYLSMERRDHTLQPTALVHEAYCRLLGNNHPGYENRSHFLSIAGHAMRQILIDHARGRKAQKRGGGQADLSLDEGIDASAERPSSLIQVEDALQALEKHDPHKARLIEMRFFGGMTAEESAEVLGIPVQKVRGELRIAQAWLKRELSRQNTGSATDEKKTRKK